MLLVELLPNFVNYYEDFGDFRIPGLPIKLLVELFKD